MKRAIEVMPLTQVDIYLGEFDPLESKLKSRY